MEKFVDLNNLRINYWTGGTGPPVLIVPGFMMRAYAYRRFGQLYINKGYEVFILTMPGVSPSDHLPTNWQFGDYSKLMIRFIQRFDLYDLILVGHSMGGAIVSLVARQMPDRISKLVLLSTVGLGQRKSLWQWFWLRWQDLDKRLLPRFVRKFIFNYFTNYKKVFTQIRELDLTEDFKQISVFTEIYWAEDDKMLPLSIGRQVANLIPGAKFEIMKGVLHEWPLLNPQIYDPKIPKAD